MIDTEIKKKKQAEWLKVHTLTQDQFKQLIENKVRRAKEHNSALIKREALCGGR
jgi:hypothetical protein